MNLIDIGVADLDEFLEINNQAVPHVNALDRGALTDLLDQACYARQFRDQNEMAAFLLVLMPGQPYQSLNYRWFAGRYDQFAYVDRIVVVEKHRGKGLAERLYTDLTTFAQEAKLSRLCCEVNLQPPNPKSSDFHRKLGFESVGEQSTEGGAKTVELLVKALD